MTPRIGRTLVTLVMFALGSIAAAAQTPTVSAAQRSDIERVVAEQVRAYYQALESMDTAKSAGFWSPSRTRGNWQGQLVPSPAQIQANQNSAFASRQAHRFAFDEVSVLVLSADFAVASARGSFRNELKNGNVANFHYAVTQLWGRENGAWKLITHGESTLAK